MAARREIGSRVLERRGGLSKRTSKGVTSARREDGERFAFNDRYDTWWMMIGPTCLALGYGSRSCPGWLYDIWRANLGLWICLEMHH